MKLGLVVLVCAPVFAQEPESPPLNVLWLIAEDMGPELGCYGTPEARTPHLDRLAAEGVRFSRAFTPAPVCSTSRSGFMTGMAPITIGAHNHRSHRSDGHALPEGVRVITDWLRPAGYFTANVRDLTGDEKERFLRGTGKTDWNFHYAGQPFDGDRWDQLGEHEPFYAQINFSETHRGRAWNTAGEHIPQPSDPDKVVFPPYYPDHELVREDWAQYLNAVMALDVKVGRVLAQLEADGLAERTVVVFFADHGRAMVRGKQWPYDSGLHVPLIVRWPKSARPPAGFAPGSVDERLVSILDVTATTLAFCGVDKPETMHGRVLFGETAEPERQYVFGGRDRGDETLFRIRTARDRRYRYLRNFMPERPFLSLNRYKEWSYPVIGLMRELHARGALTEAQARLFAPRRPVEELYDLDTDLHETVNLAESSAHAKVRARMRGALDEWIESADDQGRFPEPPGVRLHWERAMAKNYGARLRSRERESTAEHPSLGAGGHTAPALLQGAMVGEVTAHGAILQTRLTAARTAEDGDVPGARGWVRFEVATRPDFVNAVATPWREAAPTHDYIIKERLTGLSPGTRHFFRVVHGPDRSRLQRGAAGTFATHPGASASARTSFVVVTGMSFAAFHESDRAYAGPDAHVGYPALATMLDLAPDFFVGTGDNVYYDKPKERPARTEAELRRKWHEQFVQARFVDLYSRVPTYWQKDDHDHRYNDCDTTGEREPSSALGIRVFREQVPVVDPEDPDAETYRTVRVSRDLQLWFLESRDYRSPNDMPDGPEKTLWGTAQREWLKRTLVESDAAFKLVVSPTPLVGPDDGYKRDNHTNPRGFRHEGRAFLEWARAAKLDERGLVFLCGDRHWQYHSIDPTGFDEFSCGALVDANARLGPRPGAEKSTDPEGRVRQPYTSEEATGGFLRVVVDPGEEDAAPRATFELYDEAGVLVYSFQKNAERR